ncbi:hypothetical protein KBD33_06095 [Candidatus Gracilibacteria bacterium]|nr:hypothetical protein [Candidatus Gracilibacteria bacterium]
MRKIDVSGNHRKHRENIKEAGIIKIDEKRSIIGRFINEEVYHILNPEDIMISTTGSDGRYENKAHPGVRSNLELQIITRTDHDQEKVNELIFRLKELVCKNIENIEHKRLGIDKISVYNNNSDLVFPTRFYDSVSFFDPSELRSNALKRMSEEIITHGKLSSKMYDRFRVHKKTMETGIDKFHSVSYEGFNINTGIIHYDPLKNLFGIKNGPLRYVQYLLAVALMRYIRDSKTHPSFIDTLPTHIFDRLDFINMNGLSTKNKSELAMLQSIYEFFLHVYHEMQYRHFSEGTTQFIIEDHDILKEIQIMLTCLNQAYKIEQFYPVKK